MEKDRHSPRHAPTSGQNKNRHFPIFPQRGVDEPVRRCLRKKPFAPPGVGARAEPQRGDPERAFPDGAALSQNAREVRRSLPVLISVPDLVRRGCGVVEIGVSTYMRR